MGGSGSGNWSRWDTKSTTAGYLRLDVRHLARENMLRAGLSLTWRWTRSHAFGETSESAIGINTFVDAIELDYTSSSGDGEPEVIRYRVPITWTDCNYGSRRPWFLCPGRGCGRRVAMLYGGRYFLCRRCHDLVYESQRESEAFRLMSKSQAIRCRLGGSASLAVSFPEKPKGMHWATFERLREIAGNYDRASLQAMRARLDGFYRRVEAIRPWAKQRRKGD